MQFRKLSLSCACGLAPARIKQLGLSTEHQLVIHWRCSVCKRDMYIVKELAECWRDCPKPEKALAVVQPNLVQANKEVFRRKDAEFLHSLGVKFPDEEESETPRKC